MRKEDEHLTAAPTGRSGDDDHVAEPEPEPGPGPAGDAAVEPPPDDRGADDAAAVDAAPAGDHLDERSGGEHDRAEDDGGPAWTELSTTDEPPQGMIPARARRRTSFERGSMRVLATGGIIGLATLLGAILVSQEVAGWIVGLAIGLTSVILAALLWSSRQL